MAIPFRFIHCGDLHLGAPFQRLHGLREHIAEQLVKATYNAFSNIIDLAIQERVQAILISGDIYDSEYHNMEAQVRFVRELERATEKGIAIFIVFGNHDPMEAWKTKVSFPKGVHVFSAYEVERQSLLMGGEEVAAIYGQSHATKEIGDDLAARFRAHAKDHYAIGLLHASVGGYEGTAYAPTTLDVLRDAGMDYWALGHIHKRTVINENPYVVYPGNPQGLKRNEEGAKGCYLVSVGANGHTEITFHETSAIRLETVEIDISQLTKVSDISEMIRHKKKWIASKVRRPLLLRIVFVGEGPLATLCADASTLGVWLEEAQGEVQGQYGLLMVYAMENQTRPPLDLEERRALPDLVGDYLAAYDHSVAQEDLKAMLESRTEVKHLKSYRHLLSDDLVERALKRAEREGVLRLLGDHYED